MTARITILGAGFAALTAIRELRRRRVDARIDVVAPHDHLTYLPSSIWIPAGLRTASELDVNLAGFFARHDVTWRQGCVTKVLDGGRRGVADTSETSNDVLLVASGGRFLRRLPGIEHAIIPCDGIRAAETLRDRLAGMDGGRIALGFATNPNEPAAMRGGPMFEFLFGLDTLLRWQGRRDRFSLTFFSPSAQPGQRLGPRAVQGLLREMSRQGIATDLGHKLVGFTPDRVVTEASDIPADMILFMPGMTGPGWLEDSDLPRTPGGFVSADALCRVPGHERVYVAGDAGSYPGPDWLPKQAHQADLQALTAAANIAAELAGRTATARFRSELMCIVDTLDAGFLVFRNERFNLVLPRLRLMHWLKRAFERYYLRAYRNIPMTRTR